MALIGFLFMSIANVAICSARYLSVLALVLGLTILPARAGWEVTWIERFDGDSLNHDNWTPQIQAAYNNEIQCYTDDESSANRNYEVSDGTLKITARRQQIDCPGQNGRSRPWTSGRLNSKDKAEFLFGRVEAKIKFSELRGGTWPAFWMLGNRIAEDPFKGDNDTVNWPNPGAEEIDIWEWYSNNGSRYITNMFNTSNCGREQRYSYPGGAPDVKSFHVYSIEWTADSLAFFINDEMVIEHDFSNCPQYEEPMFVLLNVAMGGTLGGTIDPTLNSATMEVDYVAHCVSSTSNNNQRCNESTPQASDDDGDGVTNSNDLCQATPAGAQVDVNGCQFFSQPQSAAPTPSDDAQDVIAIYSDFYDSIASVNTNPNWGQATSVTQVQIQGDNILKYAGLNYQGTDFENNKQDLSEFENLHLDYWSLDSSSLNIFVISPGPREIAYEIPVTSQSWQHVVIPMTTFLPVVDLSDVFQLKVEGNGTVFLDNIYFAKAATNEPVDSDGDGVVDSADQCSNTPANTSVDAVGCEVVTTPAPAPTPVVEPEPESSGGSMPAFLLFCLSLVVIARRTKR